MTRNILASVKESVDRMQLQQLSQYRDKWLESILMPMDFTPQQNIFFNAHQPGSGAWFLNSDEFRDWSLSNNKVLFCPGIPGAGKTILVSIVIDKLRSTHKPDAAGLAFVYCDFRRQQEQTTERLLASILMQLLRDRKSPDSVTGLLQKCEESRRVPQLHEMLKALEEMVISLDSTFLIIDALDELVEKERKRFLIELLNLQGQTACNLLVTSRPILQVADQLKDKPKLDIRAAKDDLHSFLATHIQDLPGFVLRDFKLQEEIMTTIADAVNGMYHSPHVLAARYMRS
jgi:Cdc6-like AAA superfamily ATPase